MGILVPNLEIQRFGVTLAMGYIAAATNYVTYIPAYSGYPLMPPTAAIPPPDPANVAQSGAMMRFSIWTDHAARLANKSPIDNLEITYQMERDTSHTIDYLYELGYDKVKAMYPNYINEQ